MRIITGAARGVRLETLEGETTRPTTERVKEALFSMIQFDIEGRSVLDLFAGSGQLGLEALSRGAVCCDFVDESADAVKIIAANAKKTKLEGAVVYNSDWRAFIRRMKGTKKYGIIFLDPPYASALTGEAVRALAEADMIADYAIIVCESGQDEYIGAPGLKVVRHTNYGKIWITLLTKEGMEE